MPSATRLPLPYFLTAILDINCSSLRVILFEKQCNRPNASVQPTAQDELEK